MEICASRLLAPFFGSSTIVWANIIGLILVYLSLGYWLGGKLADKRPQPSLLGQIILLASICIAILPFASKPFLSLALHAFSSVSTGAVVASFFATLILFALPVTLLGMVSPFAIRIGINDVQTAGTISGRLYALSTVGSILGTFIPALMTIPLIGTQRTMLSAAILLSLCAFLLLGRRSLIATAAMLLMLLIPPSAIKEQPGLLVETESAYQYIDVLQQPGGERDLELNEGVAFHSIWHPDTVLTHGAWDMFLVAPQLVDHPVRHVLIIGNAGGTVAREYARYYPDAQIDGVEIDPAVTAIGHQYFGLGDNPRLTVFDADGRAFLALTPNTYDVIIVDAYRQPYIPFYLATTEFFQLCREHLSAGGVLALNAERIPNDPELPQTIESTVAAVMPDAWSWPALKFNELIVAVNENSRSTPWIHGVMPGDISILGRLFSDQVVPADTHRTPMTDDRAPIEWITDRSLLTYIASGGRLDANSLPDG